MFESEAVAATVELKLTNNLRTALDRAFEEAKRCVREDGGMSPFTIICTSDGFDVAEHSGASTDDVYNSVRALLAQEMPEAYVLVYDGFVETDAGRSDALLAEVAKRGDALAYLLAITYEQTDEGVAFAPTYLSAGTARQLYPRGTKPIVSGLVALADERERAAAEAEGGPEIEVENADE